jgi:molecular chaperone GrpE
MADHEFTPTSPDAAAEPRQDAVAPPDAAAGLRQGAAEPAAQATIPGAAPPSAQPAAASDVAPQAAVRPDTLPGLEALLQAAELKAAEHHDAWLRAKAEVENTRRRGQEEAAKAAKFAVEKFAQDMLPVKDSLEATLVAESATLESLKAGVELTLKQLVTGMQSAGVAEISPAGEKFDPHRHQAIGTLPSEGEPNRVLNVLQKGYLLHERVLRPALVVVSAPREAAQSGS